MERSRLNGIKDTGVDRISLTNNNEYYCLGGDYLGGFSRPPRSYTCSFCKREFKSAQALGGHMNVHRRDRARLTQSPPWDGSELKPNPNADPNFLLPSQSTRLSSCTYRVPPLLSPNYFSCFSSPISASSDDELKMRSAGSPLDPWSSKGGDIAQSKTETMKPFFGVGELNGFLQEDERKILKMAEIVRLDLEMGPHGDSKEDLDLELRLGYS
ncbi:PREDICTED: transcriptional regulator SUPERMAN-like [Nelumbo nucifera]|uniref:Transcriptional regulator SUPERMAN-like n=2 Tax=Nelumbo nucifera TaxID=4432 RepID=A0A1U8B2D6_NELNU|nr:PREDICTED: transcriptional regulator SUPERMAN-like [Nelumbo nucifera]DAD19825.1 TPA_asm: hypothetical protein HUJ06_021288 [Nelumbo nucifera]